MPGDFWWTLQHDEGFALLVSLLVALGLFATGPRCLFAGSCVGCPVGRWTGLGCRGQVREPKT